VAPVTALGPGGHQGLSLDVSSEQAWEAAMAEIDKGGPLHGLVTVAGILGPIGPLYEVTPAKFGSPGMISRAIVFGR